MYLASLLVLPLLIGLVAFFFSKGRITWQELAFQEIALIILIGGCSAMAHYISVRDTELLNGRVTSKQSERVSCRHSYPCNCRTECSGSGKNETCSTVCDTCYEHPYDVSWYVYTNVGNRTIEIDRIDSQGLIQPPRWSEAYPKEPVVFEHSYDNYIKASPSTVLRKYFVDPKLKDRIPKYPYVYDYYRADKVLWDGFPFVKNDKAWQWLLSDINSDLGNTKQVNVIMIVTTEPNTDYEFAVEDKWIGGKKNDVIVLIGAPHPPEIQWTRVVSWTDAYDLKVHLRDDILDIGTLDKRDDIMNAVRRDVESLFIRKPMSDFKYLMASYQPSGGVTLFIFFLGIALSVGSTIFVYCNDVVDEEQRPKSTFHYLKDQYQVNFRGKKTILGEQK